MWSIHSAYLTQTLQPNGGGRVGWGHTTAFVNTIKERWVCANAKHMAPPNIKPDKDKLINFRLNLVVVGVLLHLSKYEGFSAGLKRAYCAVYFSFLRTSCAVFYFVARAIILSNRSLSQRKWHYLILYISFFFIPFLTLHLLWVVLQGPHLLLSNVYYLVKGLASLKGNNFFHSENCFLIKK